MNHLVLDSIQISNARENALFAKKNLDRFIEISIMDDTKYQPQYYCE